jgi:competence protein ComEC
MLEALLLGERRSIDPEVYEAFRRTGLLHIISLSGMHMAILVFGVWWFCKPAGLMRPARALVCIGATIVFLLVVPPQAPILRAAITVWVYCLAILFHRRGTPLNSLSLAAIVLLLIQPTQLFDVGWQLSFAATAGIIVLSRRLEMWVTEARPSRLTPVDRGVKPVLRLRRSLVTAAIRVLCVGVAAWLAIAGILLYHFYNVTPLGCVWTAIAAVPVTAILMLGFFKIVLSFFLPTLSLLLGYPLHFLADLLIGMIRVMAAIDPFYLLIGRVPLVLILLYYALVFFAAFVHLRRPLVKRVVCSALLLVLLTSLGTMKWQRTHRSYLSLTCLDVGHGQAIVVRLPGTTNVLFDAGSLYGADVGTRVILPYLDYEGIGRLHAVIVSHRDIDHINGLPEVVNRRPVHCVYFDHTSFTQSQDVETMCVLREHLRSRRVRAERMEETLDAGKARIRVLWPTEESAHREDLGDNDKSLVCLIEYAGRRVLLCSDIERPAQQEILRQYPALRADVVVVPHHGSVRTLDHRFLERLGPEVLLCSCGTRDYEQGRVIRSADSGELWITARDRAVSVCIDASGMIQRNIWKPDLGWNKHWGRKQQ